jgi:hypothetical protein
MRHTHCVPHKSLIDFDWLPGTAGTSGTIQLSKTVGDEGHGPVSLVILSDLGFEALQLLDSQFYL